MEMNMNGSTGCEVAAFKGTTCRPRRPVMKSGLQMQLEAGETSGFEFSAMNLTTLQRIDPDAKEIRETAGHVTLYVYRTETNDWESTGVEGPLFVVSRAREPRHTFVILNRLGHNNHYEPVSSSLQIDCHECFVTYTNEFKKVYGIDFYEQEEESAKVAQLLDELAKDCAGDAIKSSRKTRRTRRRRQRKVEDALDESSGQGRSVGRSKAPSTSPANAVLGVQVKETSPAAAATQTNSVMEFFAKVMAQAAAAMKGEESARCTEKKHPLMTLEQLERQQKPAAPQVTVKMKPGGQSPATPERAKKAPAKAIAHRAPADNHLGEPSASGSNGMEASAQLSDSSDNDSGFYHIRVPACNLPSALDVSQLSAFEKFPRSQEGDDQITPGSSPFEEIAKPEDSPPAMDYVYLRRSPGANRKKPCQGFAHPASQHRYGCAYLNVSPEAGPASAEYRSTSPTLEDLLSPETPSTDDNESTLILVPPDAFLTSSSSSSTMFLDQPIGPLTKQQLLLGFQYLLLTDPEFVNKLHEGYLKVSRRSHSRESR